jgi:hypothetical protein
LPPPKTIRLLGHAAKYGAASAKFIEMPRPCSSKLCSETELLHFPDLLTI